MFNTPHEKRQIKAVFVDASGTLFRHAPRQPSGVDLYPDAVEFLATMRSRLLFGHKIQTGIITNWGYRIHSIVEALSLKEEFDTVVCTDDVSTGKPDPEIFWHACERLGVKPEEAVHLGDSLFDDVWGAQQAGLAGIWIRRVPPLIADSSDVKILDSIHYPPVEDLKAVMPLLQSLMIGSSP